MKYNNIILIDMDDVLIDLVGAWCIYLNNKYDLNVKYDDVYFWDLTQVFTTLSYGQIMNPLTQEDFWKTVHPKKDAPEYVEKLYNTKNTELYVVTATDYRNLRYKIDHVIKPYFDFLPYENIITCHKKQLLDGRFLIDDNINNLIGGIYEPILFDAPHNRNLLESLTGIKRVDNWRDCYYYIVDNI